MSLGSFFENQIVPILTRVSPLLSTKAMYYIRFKKKLNLDDPKTLNEKILWLKFNTYKNDEVIRICADKYRVRDYLTEKGFGDYLIPLLAVYDEHQAIRWEDLPNKFVLKLNVGSGMNLIVNDKKSLDCSKIENMIHDWMKYDFWTKRAEMQYKDVKPYILIEESICENGVRPVDYKFYCMNGKADSVMVCKERDGKNHPKFFFLDKNWNLLPYTEEAILYPDEKIEKPKVIEEAFTLAEKLSKDFPFVRVDLYIVKNRIYFGELTFTPAAGLDTDFKFVVPACNKTTDLVLGEKLRLTN